MIDRVTEPYSSVTLLPEWSQWPALLERNLARRCGLAERWQEVSVERLRGQLVSAAREYVRRLVALACDRGIWLPAEVKLAAEADIERRPMVLTGHQPEIFHPGIVFKYEMTYRFAVERQLTGIAISMDCDTGNAGRFLVPQPAGDASSTSSWAVAGTRSESLVRDDGLLCHQHLLPANELEEVRRQVDRQLRDCQISDAADRFTAVMATYCQLGGESAVMAHSIVRRANGLSPGLLELPFSSLCRLPDVQLWLAQVVLDGEPFHRAYNETLDEWRELRKLRSAAHPFPNLGREGSRFELPLWHVDLERPSRRAVWAQTAQDRVELFAGGAKLATVERNGVQGILPELDQALLVPRGALITMLFRLFCSDLFVHGLGGQTYDQYTDTLIERHFGIEPPAFAVASATRYLFELQRERLAQRDEFAAHRRELEHHPERYVGQGWFSPEVDEQLRPWLEQKEQLVAALRQKRQEGVSAAEEGRQLEALRDRIRSRVNTALAERFSQLEDLSHATRQAIESRYYPWFYFST